ncbi:MAG: peptidoglycan editing factor PgeF [Candidatus Latescibacterota bacterium]
MYQPYFRLFKDHPEVVHVVTTRASGVSRGPCRSWNMGFRPYDDAEAVRENRMRLSSVIGAAPESITTGEQVHGCNVAVVRLADKGGGALDPSTRISATDALITDLTDIPLLVLIADCAAVALYDPVHKAIGIAHAGWRGTAAGIACETVRQMKKTYASNPRDMLASISPSIGRCCYEVGEDVIGLFRKSFGEQADLFFTINQANKVHLDLWEANASQLANIGLVRDNIAVAALCTACHTDVFYSHRAENGKTGRFASVIMLRGGKP